MHYTWPVLLGQWLLLVHLSALLRKYTFWLRQERSKWQSLSVCPSLCRKVVLSSQFSSFWTLNHNKDFRMTSQWLHDDLTTQSTQNALREHSKSTQRAKEQPDFVIPSEPNHFVLFVRLGVLSIVCTAKIITQPNLA